MSTSMLTGSPTARSDRLVCAQLCGMTLTSKRSPLASLTVSEMPSTAIEPLTATSGARASGMRTSSRCDSPAGSRAVISPTASTWPNTRWPPISSPIRSERSRLTELPTVQRPAVVTESVAPEASRANQSFALSTTVKQMPEVAIEPPSGISASGRRVPTTMRRPSPSAAASRIRPTSVMMPVNMRLLPGVQDISATAVPRQRPLVRLGQAERLVEGLDPERAQRLQPVAADQEGRLAPDQPVDQAMPEQARGERGAAFDQQPCDAATGQDAENLRKVQPAFAVDPGLDHLDAEPAQPPGALLGRRAPGDQPEWCGARRTAELAPGRQAQAAIEHHADRRARLEAGKTAG